MTVQPSRVPGDSVAIAGAASLVRDGAAKLAAAGPATTAPATGFRPSPHSLRNRLARASWGFVRLVLFRPSPKVLHGWRRLLLRCFGARLAPGAVVHASARIWAPWNLVMGRNACLSHDVDCYSVDRVEIGDYATVSQYAFLCTASHDVDSPDMTLTTAPIRIGAHAWVAADAFVGPGVTVGEGAVVGARASAFADVPEWAVVAGTPARVLRQRSKAVALHRAGAPA